MLDEIEDGQRRIHGYGSLNFGRNLRQCYEHLSRARGKREDLTNGDGLRRTDSGVSDGNDRRAFRRHWNISHAATI